MLYNVLLVSAVQQHESVIIIYIYPLPLEPSSHPPSLGHHGVPGWAPSVTEQLPCVTHGCYISQCCFLNSSYPLLLLVDCVYKSVLYVCVSIPTLQIGSSVPFF